MVVFPRNGAEHGAAPMLDGNMTKKINRMVQTAMGVLVALCAFGAQSAVRHQGEGKGLPGLAGTFADRSVWHVENYENRLKLDYDAGAPDGRRLVITAPPERVDVAWKLTSRRIPVPSAAKGFCFRFTAASSYYVAHFVGRLMYYAAHYVDADPRLREASNSVVWYDRNGKMIDLQDVAYAVSKPVVAWKTVRGPVPDRAASCEIRLGFDFPDIPAGQWLAFGDFSFSFDAGVAEPWFDCDAPVFELKTQSPTLDAHAVLAYEVSDASEINWDSLRIAVDGMDATGQAVRHGNVISLSGRREAWTRGLHRVGLKAEDACGNVADLHAAFLVAEPATNTPTVALRNDGVTLVDGKPVFPIGIFGVKRQASNGDSLDRAFSDLKAAGINLAQTYQSTYDPEFLSAAKRHGIFLLTSAEPWFVPDLIETGRFNRSVLAWYIGDDTSVHQTPNVLHSANMVAKAIDPLRLTAQADGVCRLGRWKSGYEDYVTATDIFIPELYPVRGETGDKSDLVCVAGVVSDLKTVAADVRRRGNGKPRACWPLLQFFKGYGAWGHFPSRSQIMGMTFAAIVHGAKGITWYTYPTSADHANEGATSSPERWALLAEIAGMIGELSPMLLAPPCVQPPAASVVQGPRRDLFGNESVGMLLARHGGSACLLAVNSSHERVRARFGVPDAGSRASVMREDRVVDCTGGTFEDDFEPYGVHIYLFKDTGKTDKGGMR